MKPIRESIADTNKTPILDKYSFNKIFINMEDILDVNKLFLDALLQYQQGNTNETFGEILVKFVRFHHLFYFIASLLFTLHKNSFLDSIVTRSSFWAKQTHSHPIHKTSNKTRITVNSYSTRNSLAA